MSRRDSTNTKPYRKPKTDIYTVLLLLAFLAITVACILLYLDVSYYGPDPTAGAHYQPPATGIQSNRWADVTLSAC